MKKKIVPLAIALLFLGMAPFFAAAQTSEERIESGRFGAGEPVAEEANPGGGESSKNYRLFLGLRAGPSLRIYTPSGDTAFTGGDTYGASLDTGFQASLQIVPLFSLQAEVVFTWDKASVWQYALNSAGDDLNPYTRRFTGLSLQIPLIAKLNFYPGKFRISPFLGGYVFLPLGKMKTSAIDEEASFSYSLSPPLGVLGGVSAGFPLGPGIIFADIRYAVDLAEPELQGGEGKTYRRHGAALSLGYELGLFKKR
ncbi:MAG: hypothetical protein LBP32_08220 [Spirochaetaceae bacterium]|jgi:hypothetical protein|nr:hypothetical protein [Spirochaetaceae bacterium]